MRRILTWAGRIILALVLAAVVLGLWKRDQIARLWAVNSLFTAEKIVGNFSGMDQAFLTRTASRGDTPVSPLPAGAPMTMPADTRAWMSERSVTSLLVLKSGQIVHESYHLGTGPDDRRIGWSLAKSFLSALFGVVMAEGHITSLDDPVTR